MCCEKQRGDIKVSKYQELRNRQQAEFNALPLGFAFGRKQFDEMMCGWGLDPDKDVDKIYHIGAGGYIQKKDADLLHQTRNRHDAELEAAITADKTGNGFVCDMFLCELENHEYSYTGDFTDALDALGYTAEEVAADKKLFKGFMRARNKAMKKK